MPFIGGRYHINPIVGQALEAAREAEAARLAGNEQGSQDESDDSGDEYRQVNAGQTEKGPIHRVEIEAAEMVPAHTGRGQRGFVARVHREESSHNELRTRNARSSSGALASRAETHVFGGHRDLISFLRDEFAKDCGGK